MSDLPSRFGAITETPVPDLWDEIRRREDGTLPSRRLSRLPVIALACIVAIAGVGGGLFLLTGLGSGRRPIADGTAVANGPIYFRVGGGDGGSWIDSVMPDGSGRTRVFPNDPQDDVHYSRISFAPDGSRIAFANYLVDRYGIYTAQPDWTDVVRLTDGVNDSWPSFSPDGTKIVFASSRDTTDRQCTPGFPNEVGCATDIYVMDADGSNVVRLTDDPAGEYMPEWSPDGTSIAFTREDGPGSTMPNRSAIFTMRPDGSEVRRISTASGGSDFWPSWSPEGLRIVFAAIRNEDWGIWVVNADGTDEHSILGGVSGDAAWYADNPGWSPDGSLVAFVGNPTTGDYSPEDALYVMRPDGSDVRMVADAPRYGVAGDIAWRPVPADAASSSPPIGEPASVEVNVTTMRGIAEFPSTVVAGDGGAWVSAPRNDGSGAGDIVRLDARTRDVVARIPVRGLPTWEFGGGGMTVANGRVWIAGSLGAGTGCCHALVSMIDEATDAVVDEIEVPGDVSLAADVWVDGGAVYVLSFAADDRSLVLARVDIETHETRWQTSIPAFWGATVFTAGDSVWVLATAPHEDGPVEVNTLYRLDPGSGTLLDEVGVPQTVWAPVVNGDALWWRGEDGVQRLDPSTGRLVGDPIRPAPGCCTGPFVGDGWGGVWVMSSPGAAVDRSIWHIDAAGTVTGWGTIDDRTAFEEMQGQSYGFDPVTQTIWVQHYRDSVSRVEIRVTEPA